MSQTIHIGKISDRMSNKQQIGRITERSRRVFFEWEIPNFFSYTEENTQYFSPEFHVLSSTWCLGIRPLRTVLDGAFNYVSLCLRNQGKKLPNAGELLFAIKSASGDLEFKKKRSFNDQDLVLLGIPQFVEKQMLISNKDKFVPGGTLTIVCSVLADEQHFDSRPDKLMEDLKGMFSSKKHADVTLKINDDTIRAHKAILAARSSVFAAMFENDMEEKKTGVVRISDCDLETFNVFLHYIYTSEVIFPKCDVFYLYKVADKYGVPELMSMCLNFMIRNLTVENVFETFLFGRRINEDRIVSYAQSFFNKNFSEIVYLSSWQSLLTDDPDLANDLLKGMAFKIKVIQD